MYDTNFGTNFLVHMLHQEYVLNQGGCQPVEISYREVSQTPVVHPYNTHVSEARLMRNIDPRRRASLSVSSARASNETPRSTKGAARRFPTTRYEVLGCGIRCIRLFVVPDPLFRIPTPMDTTRRHRSPACGGVPSVRAESEAGRSRGRRRRVAA